MTRDSWTLTIIILGAVAAYLAAMPPPLDWTWTQWMQSVAALAAVIAGKLATSPLPGVKRDNRITDAELKRIVKKED